MPELPEVETIVRELDRNIAGKNLCQFLVFDKERLPHPPRLGLPRKISSVRRRGKFVIFDLENGLRCLIHLRMTGRLFTKGEQSAGERGGSMRRELHERARFTFSDGSVLQFADARRFGTIEWRKKEYGLPRLGPEPLSANFNAQKLGNLLYGRKMAIKSSLLDQRLVAGIGNIYADESLWTAKIHPLRRCGTLKKAEIARLTASIKKVLREAVKKGGFTLRDYRRTDGNFGDYQNYRKVYGRAGEKCLCCGWKIKKMKVGGRSSYFCPICQGAKRV